MLIEGGGAALGREHAARVTERAAAAGSLVQAPVVIGGTVLTFCVPALWDVLSDPARPYGYIAADAFYYFTIAANWVELGTPSFDQAHPTNGFHPLWQWLTALAYAALKALGFARFTLVPVAVVSGVLLLSAAIVLLGLVHAKKGRVSPAFALLPLGAWPLMIAPVWWSARVSCRVIASRRSSAPCGTTRTASSLRCCCRSFRW